MFATPTCVLVRLYLCTARSPLSRLFSQEVVASAGTAVISCRPVARTFACRVLNDIADKEGIVLSKEEVSCQIRVRELGKGIVMTASK